MAESSPRGATGAGQLDSEAYPIPYKAAGHVQRMLSGRSQRGRKVPDLLVAAMAEDGGLIVLHYDADFDRIAAVTGQKRGWVTAPGSID